MNTDPTLAPFTTAQLHNMRNDAAVTIATAVAADLTAPTVHLDRFREYTAELDRRYADLTAWMAAQTEARS